MTEIEVGQIHLCRLIGRQVGDSELGGVSGRSLDLPVVVSIFRSLTDYSDEDDAILAGSASVVVVYKGVLGDRQELEYASRLG